jgi:hypothetical protein
MPLLLTGPSESAAYFSQIDEFIAQTLGEEARSRYSIIVDDPEEVARRMVAGLQGVRDFRFENGDAYYFNWRLAIDHEFQKPFRATHESMRALDLTEELPVHVLAANLRRIFSGIVSGNVREDTMADIESRGPFEIYGSERIMGLLNSLLQAFVDDGRMKLAAERYAPCYRVVHGAKRHTA